MARRHATLNLFRPYRQQKTRCRISQSDSKKTGVNALKRNTAGRNLNLQHPLQKLVWHMSARAVLYLYLARVTPGKSN
ncbi:hypothetical protein BofuT4_uP106420.1 [Botrytis cinerea T4]|uniref:Uncharacterized protein n=1 Tax=Botryotinia fuckeliana (strain T4) TaxID=999810 RepID=G2Y6K6_BOTF4|nr:hypothetical protein BofuT4_uP106420.1 [Botrytis cinerea T4]